MVVVNASLGTERKDAKLAPLLSKVIPSFPGIGSDIKKPGVDGAGLRPDPAQGRRVPAEGLAGGVRRPAQDHLPGARLPQPRSTTSSSRSAARRCSRGSPAARVEERVLENSYHVATLDNDAPTIFAGSLDFVRAHAPAAARAEPWTASGRPGAAATACRPPTGARSSTSTRACPRRCSTGWPSAGVAGLRRAGRRRRPRSPAPPPTRTARSTGSGSTPTRADAARERRRRRGGRPDRAARRAGAGRHRPRPGAAGPPHRRRAGCSPPPARCPDPPGRPGGRRTPRPPVDPATRSCRRIVEGFGRDAERRPGPAVAGRRRTSSRRSRRGLPAGPSGPASARPAPPPYRPARRTRLPELGRARGARGRRPLRAAAAPAAARGCAPQKLAAAALACCAACC